MDYDVDYFAHFIIATEVIERMKDFKPDQMSFTMKGSKDPLVFEPHVGSMPKIWKHMNSGPNSVQPYCVYD